MGAFIVRRLLMLIPFLFLISALAFVIIQLPPGSFVDTYKRNLEAQGGTVNEGQLKALEARYGLDKPQASRGRLPATSGMGVVVLGAPLFRLLSALPAPPGSHETWHDIVGEGVSNETHDRLPGVRPRVLERALDGRHRRDVLAFAIP